MVINISEPGRARREVSRRAVLGVMAAVGAAGTGGYLALRGEDRHPVALGSIARVEAARHHSGRTVSASLTAERAEVDLGGKIVNALTYDANLPGRALRVGAGDLLRVTVRNLLDQATSVHWHGLAIRNDMDGVPDLTAPEIGAGGSARYEFVVPDPGTFWLHPHSGLQLDWGLHAPLIVEDPAEPGGYDQELIVVLDDWSPGLGRTPEQILTTLQAGGGSSGMGGMSGGTGGGSGMSDAGDVDYPAYLLNGRLPEAPTSLAVKPGQRVRLRLINAAADTTFDVALGGHRMRVTHSDGFELQPVDVDCLRISMGERYDAVVTVADGIFPLVGVPLGKAGAPARMLLRSGSGTAPPPDLVPPEVSERRLTLSDLVADARVRLPERSPDSTQDVILGGDMGAYRWTINGHTYDDTRPLTVRPGELTRLRVSNRTMMLHPLHLHGHTFAVRNGGGARKDTLLVQPMQTVDVDVMADNPGRWMLHCHNAFHMAAGMMTRLDYVN